MLVVCNGAVKSGSTWLYNIVQNIAEFEWPEARYISHSNTKHPTIKENYLSDFLRETDIEQHNIISKNHYGKSPIRELLLSSPHTRILDMSRDARDVIVSSYYDSCRREGFEGSFGDYYWHSGRFLVDSLKRYHEVWAPAHPQVIVTSYETLKSDFYCEVMKIGRFLGIELNGADLTRIEKETSIDSLRTSYGDDDQYNTEKNPFFRKGEIGDWRNHFEEKMISDYEKIAQNGIGKFDFYHIRNRFLNRLNQISAR